MLKSIGTGSNDTWNFFPQIGRKSKQSSPRPRDESTPLNFGWDAWKPTFVRISWRPQSCLTVKQFLEELF